MNYVRLVSLVGLLLSSCIDAKPISEWLSQAQERFVTEVLPNGLTVVCYPLPGTYKVHVGITYDVGSKNERPNEYGLAHMVEHMMFKGTYKMSEIDLKEIAKKYHIGEFGEGFNAFTSADTTRYFFNADKNNWPIFINILADCMFNVRFDDNHFASEVKAVIEELNLRSTNLFAIIGDMYGSLMYPHSHPYHHDVGGYKELLLNATSGDLKAFYRRNYHPAKALLTIVGDVIPEEALAAARQAFVSREALPAPALEVLEQPSIDFTRKKMTIYKPIPKAQYTHLWKVPKDPIVGVHASCAAWVLAQRLERLLVTEKDLVFTVATEAFQNQLGGVFLYTFDLKSHASDKEVKALIRGELDKLINEGPTEVELDRYKKQSEAQFLKMFDNCSSIALALEHDYFPTRCTDVFFSSLERKKSISKEMIKEFVRTYLRQSLTYTMTILPIPDEEKAQWTQMKQEEDTYEQIILQQKMRETIIEQARYVHELPDPELAEVVAQKPDIVVTLKNGLTVYLKKRDVTPFVSCSLQFKHPELFGIALSLDKKAMVRLFAMNLLAEGTTQYSKEQNHEFFDLRGASFGVSPAGASLTCLAEDFSEVATRALLILKDPAYDAKILAQELSSLRDQFVNAKMNPGYMADRLLKLELFKEYAWMQNDDELSVQLSTITRDDLLAFNKQYLNPRNMFLVIVGNIDLDTIVDELEHIPVPWQGVGARPLFEKVPTVPDITPKPGKEFIHTIPVDQVYLTFGRVTDYYDSKDILALKLIESYVYHKIFNLREQKGLFYAFRLDLASSSVHQKGSAEIMVPLSVGNVEVAETAIKELLGEIARDGIPQDAIDNAKEYYQMSLVKSCTTNDDLMVRFAGIVADGKPFDVYERRLAQLQELTKKEVDEVTRTYLEPSSWTIYKAGRIEVQQQAQEDTFLEKPALEKPVHVGAPTQAVRAEAPIQKLQEDTPKVEEKPKSRGGFLHWLFGW